MGGRQDVIEAGRLSIEEWRQADVERPSARAYELIEELVDIPQGSFLGSF